MVGIEGFSRNTSLTTRSSKGNPSRSSIEIISPYARHSSRRRAWISGDPARWKRHQDIMILERKGSVNRGIAQRGLHSRPGICSCELQ